MSRFGFVGPAYTSASPLVDSEALINWFVERAESPNSRVPWVLLRTPGLSPFANLGATLPSVREMRTFNGRTFAVSGTHLFELTGGAVSDYGAGGVTPNNNILDDGLPVTMVAGGTIGGNYPSQILIASGGTLTVFSLTSNTFQPITTPPTNILMVDFLEGFFIALSANNSFSISAAEDATTWPGLSVAQVSIFSDQLLALKVSNSRLWVFGGTRAVAYYNSGAPLFPFDVDRSSPMEVGILAQFSVARVALKAGTTIAWLGGDERGAAVVYFANGYVPQKVSDSALDFWLSQQTQITDATGWSWQFQGHNFYSLWFPSAKTTWTLDADLGWWFQQSSLVNGIPAAWRVRCHAYGVGQHLVGDRLSGNVYSMSNAFFSETIATGNAIPIVRTRIGPTVSNEGGQIPVGINEFQVDFATGKGPQSPLTTAAGLPRDPYAMFSYSEDFGQTWTPERMIPCGQAGVRKMVAIDRRLGSWRSWTPRVVVSDPIDWSIADAFINTTQDSKPRYAKRIAEIA